MRDLKLVTPIGDRRVAQIWQSLMTNPKLKVKQLAKSVGLSESRLEHLIVEHAGTTIRDLKNSLKIERLHEARRQLLETTDTILDIRERAGYVHESNFIRDFNNLFDLTPAAYRRHGK